MIQNESENKVREDSNNSQQKNNQDMGKDKDKG